VLRRLSRQLSGFHETVEGSQSKYGKMNKMAILFDTILPSDFDRNLCFPSLLEEKVGQFLLRNLAKIEFSKPGFP
jgi:hypothetical protein